MMHGQKNIKLCDAEQVYHYRVLTLAAYRQATRTLIESDGTICCLYTSIPSWRWAFDARNM